MFWYYLTDLILGSGRGDKYRAVDNIFLLSCLSRDVSRVGGSELYCEEICVA